MAMQKINFRHYLMLILRSLSLGDFFQKQVGFDNSFLTFLGKPIGVCPNPFDLAFLFIVGGNIRAETCMCQLCLCCHNWSS